MGLPAASAKPVTLRASSEPVGQQEKKKRSDSVFLNPSFTFVDRTQDEYVRRPVHEDFRKVFGEGRPLSFVSGLFFVKGTVWSVLWPEMIVSIGVGFLASWMYDVHGLCLDFKLTQLLGFVVTFLLVFRSNLAYDRFYEGRKEIGKLQRNLANVLVEVVGCAEWEGRIKDEGFFQDTGSSGSTPPMQQPQSQPQQPEKQSPQGGQTKLPQKAEVFQHIETLRRWLCITYSFVRQDIRESREGFNPQGDFRHLPFDHTPTTFYSTTTMLRQCMLAREVDHFKHLSPAVRPAVIATQMIKIVNGLVGIGALIPQESASIVANVKAALEDWKACLRIVTTPMPFNYAYLLNLLLFLFVFSTPFAITSVFPFYATPAISFVIAIGFYGLDALGRELENPFQWEVNDLDLSVFGRGLHEELLHVLRTIKPSARSLLHYGVLAARTQELISDINVAPTALKKEAGPADFVKSDRPPGSPRRSLSMALREKIQGRASAFAIKRSRLQERKRQRRVARECSIEPGADARAAAQAAVAEWQREEVARRDVVPQASVDV